MSKTIALLAIAISIGASPMAKAATVRDDTMACPSLSVWRHVMEKTKREGFPAGVHVGNDEGCVSFQKGTEVSVIGRDGDFSRVRSVGKNTYYFISVDLQ